MSDRPDPRTWREIREIHDQPSFNDILTDRWVDLGAMRSYEGQMYARIPQDDGRDLWLELEHYIYRAAHGELPGLDYDVGVDWARDLGR